MRYLSVCSGIEAASVAWEPLGWEPVAFSEVDKFPSAVLAHHYPSVPNLGDMNDFHAWNLGAIDLLCGGTPCQSFSVAGLRQGLDDPRGNLALVYCGILERLRPRWFAWENVPGVLSSGKGRDFGSFLGAVAQLGYGWSYRVLDAQFFGVPQRRRRVFVVGYLGDWRRSAAVLFERESMCGNTAKGRGKKQEVAKTLRGRANSSHREDTDNFVTHSLRGEGFDASEDGTGRGTPLVPVLSHACLAKGGSGRPDPSCETFIAFANTAGDTNLGMSLPGVPPITTRHGDPGNVLVPGQAVRRLTVEECEALQGFPRGYTLIDYRGKPACDGPRYKAIGNSMAVPCMSWIGKRVQMVDNLND